MTSNNKDLILNDLRNQFEASEPGTLSEYRALLAVHNAAFNDQIDSKDIYRLAEGLERGGALEEIGSAHSSRESDEILEYPLLTGQLLEPYAELLYTEFGTSNPEALRGVTAHLIDAGQGNSLQREHEALLDLDQNIANGNISLADAYAILEHLQGYSVRDGLQTIVMAHEIGLRDQIPHFVDTIFIRRVIDSSYGGHGSDFDHYDDERYVARFGGDGDDYDYGDEDLESDEDAYFDAGDAGDDDDDVDHLDTAPQDLAKVLSQIRRRYPDLVLTLDDEETRVHYPDVYSPGNREAVMEEIYSIFQQSPNMHVRDRFLIEDEDEDFEDDEEFADEYEAPTNEGVDAFIAEMLRPESDYFDDSPSLEDTASAYKDAASAHREPVRMTFPEYRSPREPNYRTRRGRGSMRM